MSDLDLFMFQCQMARELERADRKHGTWEGNSLDFMLHAINGELVEVARAANSGDAHGEHGMKNELIQVAVTAFKMWRRV